MANIYGCMQFTPDDSINGVCSSLATKHFSEAVHHGPYASITAMWRSVGSYKLGVYTQNVILISLTQR